MSKVFIPLFLIISNLASAGTYYVSTTGNNNNPGTISQPWATWQKAFSTAVAGDTVYFRGGIYYITSGVYSSAKGTRANPICYFNYPGEVPILDGIRRTSPNEGLMFSGAEFIRLKGLIIRNNRQLQSNFGDAQGVYFSSCKNVHVENCKTYNNGMTGFKIQNVDTAYFYNCDTWNNCDSLNINYPGGKGDGFFIYNSLASHATSYIYYKGCRSWHNSDDGFDTYSEGRVVVEDCWSFSNGYLSGDGAGFKFGFKYLSTPNQPLDRRFVNCLAADNKFIGFTANNNGLPCITTEVFNCTAYGNDFGSFWAYSSCTNPKVSSWKNNLTFNSATLSSGGMTANAYNSWTTPPGVTVNSSDFLSTDIGELDDDRQADGSLPDINFLKIAPGSDLIDAGTDVGLSFNGSAPDLGYSEYLSGGAPASPIYVSSAVENAAPSILVMNYNLSLANIIPAASAFTVSVNSVARTVNSVAVSGTRVSLTLSGPVANGNTVTVAYTKPATNPLQTASGGQAATITAQPVTNNVSAVAPVYQNSSVENPAPSILVMNYNLSLANIIPAASAFSVSVNSVARTVSSVAISGTRVSLTLSGPVANGNTVTVVYTKPATNPLQTASGGQAATITAQPVTNNVSAVAPVYQNSSVENAAPSILVMNYNLSLANIVPAASAFSVSVNSVARTVNSVAVSGTRVSLTLSGPVVNGNTVTVAYTKPATNPLQTASGGQAASITAQPVTNNVAAVAPVYQNSSVENAAPSILVINYNLSLANIVPAASAFSVSVNSVARTVNSVAVSGTRVSLTLSGPIVYGNTVTVAYTKPATNPLQTASGGQAATITAQPVTNGVGAVAPVYVSSSVENTTPVRIEMTYNLTLANIVPAVTAFLVTINSVVRSISSVAVSGTKVLVTLSSPIAYGDIVTIAYTKPATNPVQTIAGGQAASLAAQSVVNNVAPVVPLYVNSSVENASPSTLEMNYNLALANIVPAASSFIVNVNSVARTVSSVAVSGSKVSLTLSSPVVSGNVVTVAYTKPAANPLQTASGGQAASITAQTVVNNVVLIPLPVYAGSSIENTTPARIEMTYNLTLANVVPAVSAFSVTVNSVVRSISTVAVSGSKAFVTLSSPVLYGDIITVSYTKPATSPLQTIAGGQAATITPQTVTNNVLTVAPVYLSSSIANATPSILEMTYNLTLANIFPAASAFTVRVNSVVRTVNSVSTSGTKVLLTLSNPVVYGDVVTVSYTKPATNPIQTATGGQAATISSQNVSNNTASPANTAPSVGITSPVSNSSFTSPAIVIINANASDSDGTIILVEFFSGSTLLGSKSSPPFSYTWNNVVKGTYSITAVATDDDGAKTTSSAISVIVLDPVIPPVNQLPTVSISSPIKGQEFTAPADIDIAVSSSDPDGNISKVELFIGSVKIGELTTSPYIYKWRNVYAGKYQIKAITTDNSNAAVTSSVIDVTVKEKPVYDANSEIISIYPNPSDGHFTVEFLIPLQNPRTEIRIYDLAGHQVHRESITSEVLVKDFDLSNLKRGIYIMTVSNRRILTTKKIIIY